MIPLVHPVLDSLFLVSVVIIWLMIGYQVILAFAGYRYRQHLLRIDAQDNHSLQSWPAISIMVPAHNEERVIASTIDRLSKLDYPSDRLEILVINDGSHDATQTIVEDYIKKDSRVSLINLAKGQTGHGKAHALNQGLEHCKYEIIAIYDADNRPESDSLRKLVPHLLTDEKCAAVIGKFRTLNRNRNGLTRLINIETLAFQWILQAGRFCLSRIAILPGTNYIIKRSVLQQCGGWDEKAITEDSELSVRIYQKGFYIKFIPLSVTWEQEPETLKVWIRQRTRWVRGNNYVLRKFAMDAVRLKSRFLVTEFFYLFALYYLFLLAIVLSHLLFVLSGLGIVALKVPGPYFAVWLSAFVLFIMEILLVLSYENEDSPKNIFYTILMYFTYCQLWLFIVFRGLFFDARRHRVGIWDKTERFLIPETDTEKERTRL